MPEAEVARHVTQIIAHLEVLLVIACSNNRTDAELGVLTVPWWPGLLLSDTLRTVLRRAYYVRDDAYYETPAIIWHIHALHARESPRIYVEFRSVGGRDSELP